MTTTSTTPIAKFTGVTYQLDTEETAWGNWSFQAEEFTGSYEGLKTHPRFRHCNTRLVADNGDGCAIVGYYYSLGD